MASSLEVDTLFKTHTIEEINNIEKDIRGQLEKKKQQLRMTVGERYRDLINAADTIKEMQVTMNEVASGISNLKELCSSFSPDVSGQTVSEQSSSDNAFYSLATQMDLLVDTPEKIWSALDNGEFLNACELYLLSDHIVNHSLNINTSSSDLYASFPILHHQWAAISHFKNSILKGSKRSLKDTTLPDKNVCESLCSIALLEGVSPRQVFTEFLLARQTAIKDLFKSNLYSTSVKKQICEMTYILKLTCQQIVTLFNQDEDQSKEGALFHTMLREITATGAASQYGKAIKSLFGREMDLSTIAPYLPATVSEFSPKIKSVIVPLPKDHLQKCTLQWLSRCRLDIQSGLESFLPFVTTVKGLAAIRDAVFQLLSSDTENSTGEWNNTSQTCFGKLFSIWDEILRTAFLQRIQAITEKGLENSFADLQNELALSLSMLGDGAATVSDASWDHDVVSFMWHDFPHDHLIANRENHLPMKIKYFTPLVRSTCSKFDNCLMLVQEDIRSFLNEKKETDESSIKNEVQRLLFEAADVFVPAPPFDKYADSAEICKQTSDCFLRCTDALVESLNGLLSQLQTELTEMNGQNEITWKVDKVTFLGRLCLAIPDLCEHIEQLVSNDGSQKARPDKTLKRLLSSSSYRAAAHKPSSEIFVKFEAALKSQSMRCFAVWVEWLHKVCSDLVRETFNNSVEHALLSTTNWSGVVIEEEGEGGVKMKSTIQVPNQLSFYLSSLLFRVVEEFQRIGGGNSIDLATKILLKTGVARVIIDAHACHLQQQTNQLFQSKLLQMLFDVRFIVKLFTTSKISADATELHKSSNKLISTLESHIDPFDLDVFSPHIQINVDKLIQKTALLYGSISLLDKPPTSIATTSSSTTEEHNSVQLITNPPRFMLLPYSDKSSQHAAKQEQMYDDTPQICTPLYRHQTAVLST